MEFKKVPFIPFLIIILLLIIFTSCQKREWNNPFDLGCPKELFTPSNFTAKQVGDSVVLNWNQPNNQISGFVIEKNTTGGSWSQFYKPEKNTLTVYDSKIEGGLKYGYQLYAFAGSNNSNLLTAEITPVFNAKITTTAATDITANSATVGGNIVSDGGSPVTERGICYSTSQNPSIDNTKLVSGNGIGAFSNSITLLLANTLYFVRAYAINEKGIAYGNQVTITTTANLASLTTSVVTAITPTSAICGGIVLNNGGATITESGVCYSSSSIPTIANTKMAMGSFTAIFSNTISGFLPNTTYYIRAYAINSKGTAYGNEVNFKTSLALSLATITTNPSSNITSSSATIGGNVTNDGNATVTERGICYSTSQNPTINSTKLAIGLGIGSFSGTTNGLTSNTTYYLRAYAINSQGTTYGNQVNFTTIHVISLPSLSTSTPTSISNNSAYLSGTLISDGNDEVTENGFCYATITNPTTNSNRKYMRSGIGIFGLLFEGLLSNTTYYVRAYAINGQGTAYGNEVNFKTSIGMSLATLTTSTPTSITINSATLGGNVTIDGNATVTERGVCYSTSASPTTSSTKLAIGSGTGSFSSTAITGLSANTTYYVRAYAINSKGTAYGNEQIFKTSLALSLATLTTNIPTSITTSSATLSGNITSDGNATVTERGVCYSTNTNPTTSSTKVAIGSGIASFSNSITGLTANTTYYVRAYAINSQGTAYGNEVNFKTDFVPSLASITTIFPSNITSTTFISGGNITSDGGVSITARGVCCSSSPNPTVLNYITNDGTGTGRFTSSFWGLSANTTYYIRAYATNSQVTAYGNEVSFKTSSELNTVTDIDGNVYHTVTIGTQVWMVENLKTTKYNDGTNITNVTDASAWSNLTTGAYCWYNNDATTYKNTYGALYDWYTVNTDKLAPVGWHIPTDAEWTKLTDYLGGESIAGGQLKETGTPHWANPNTGATNSTGFTALPGGVRGADGAYGSIGYSGFWWSSAQGNIHSAWRRCLFYNGNDMSRYDGKGCGISVRCIKD